MVMLMIGTMGLCLYSLAWPWIIASSPWGQLMLKYAIILTKIDVARGRCVPMPTGLVHASSRFSLLPMLQSKGAKTTVERVVDALNPYTASPNIRYSLQPRYARSARPSGARGVV